HDRGHICRGLEIAHHRLLDTRPLRVDPRLRPPFDVAVRHLELAAVDQPEGDDTHNLLWTVAQAREQVGVRRVDLWRWPRLIQAAREIDRDDHGEGEQGVELEE